MTKDEFMQQWAVTGMPTDKIRLANAAWEEAIKSEREACAGICDAKAKILEAKASECDGDEDLIINLRAAAWLISVCSAEIRGA